MPKFNTKKLVMVGLFIALQIIFTRVFSIQLPTVRIGFTFIPLSMCAIMFGPLTGGLSAAVADVIGLMLFPTAAYFPGFTLTAFLSGVVYGLFMHNKNVRLWNVIVAVGIVCLILNLGLDTLWLSMMYDKGVLAILPGRIMKTAILMPVQIPLIMFFWKYVALPFQASFA